MERRIVEFSQDEAGHWVATLECGHRQHVRHDPPWQVRPWVIDPVTRHARIGAPLNCPFCDRPDDEARRPDPEGRDMASYIALLGGVNLGANKSIRMADLCTLVTRCGLDDVRSLGQSGNVVCRAVKVTPAALERRLERELEARLGLETEVFVRTAAEWRAMVEGNPFEKEARLDPGHLQLICLKGTPATGGLERLRVAIRGSEQVALGRRHAYAVYPDGIGRSTLTTALMDKMFGTRTTARNWNTVLKLAAAAES